MARPKKKRDAVNRIVSQIAKLDEKNLFHAIDALIEINRRCNGAEGFAECLKEGLDACKPGTLQHLKYVQCWQRFIEIYSRVEDAGVREESQMSDEELTAEAERLAQDVLDDAPDEEGADGKPAA